jgi:hypothetical protein
MDRIEVNAHDQTTVVERSAAPERQLRSVDQPTQTGHPFATELAQSSGVAIDVQCRHAAETPQPGAASAVARAAPRQSPQQGAGQDPIGAGQPPYLDPETPVLDAVIQRAKSEGVDLVMVAGEVVYEGGRFTRVDRATALRELHQSLQRALADDEVERRKLSKALLPHVRRFYADYFDAEAHVPYYRPNSRV